MLKEFKPALLFLVKYVVVYLILNTIYAWYVEGYAPDADPVTKSVTKQCAAILSVFDPSITYQIVPRSENVPLLKGANVIVEVFEGCNSLNVVIVYVSFLAAFTGPWRSTLQYLASGIVIIYVVNLVRVMALFGVALHFPNSLYFFHKFFFTGIIYLVVFVLWYLWVRQVRQEIESNRATDEADHAA